MDRQQLEALSFDELSEEARRYGLRPADNPNACIDAIMSHLERKGPARDFCATQADESRGVPRSSDFVNWESGQPISARHAGSITNGVQPGPTEGALPQLCAFFADQLRLQRETMLEQSRLLCQVVNSNNSAACAPEQSVAPDSGAHNLVPGAADPPRRASISSVATAHAVNLLSTHIPEFGGSEEEDVEIWIQTIERVAQIHGVTHDILLLAASGKVVKTARRWFDLNINSVIQSWSAFREAVVRRFKRKVLFHVATQRVEARKWNFYKESFQDYAMDKQVLLRNLRLSDEDTIHLLINGIGSRSLRQIATALRVETIDEFLEEMRRITASAGPVRKTSPPEVKQEKVRSSVNATVKDFSSPRKDEDRDSFCAHCRGKGHVSTDCIKLKKKEQGSLPASSTPAPSVAAEALFPHVTPFNNQAGDTLEIPEGPNFTVKLDELKLVHVAPTLRPGGGRRRRMSTCPRWRRH